VFFYKRSIAKSTNKGGEMPSADINTWAVLVAAGLSMVLGFVWYSMSVFGKSWMREVGLKLEDVQKGPGVGYAVAMVGALLQALVLAHFVDYTDATTVKEGLVTGLWVWVGFVAPVLSMNYVFAQRSRKLWLIDAGYFLVLLLVQGALLANWA